jgi:hypothetical protein
VPKDNTGHGTHLAGLILYIAPDVDLYVLRVFTDRKFDGDQYWKAMERVREVGRHTLTWTIQILTTTWPYIML